MKHSSRIVHSNSEGFLIEQALIRENSDYLVIAPHGQHIETATAVQSEYLGDLLNSSYWNVKGFSKDGNGFKKWHKPSTKISEKEFKLLKEFKQNYETCIAFHGLGQSEKIYIGGSLSKKKKKSLKKLMRVRLDYEVLIAKDCSKYAGQSPDNIINRFSGNSIQIEQGPIIRRTNADKVAETVAEWIKNQ